MATHKDVDESIALLIEASNRVKYENENLASENKALEDAFAWLQEQVKKSRTGVSFDFVPRCEEDPSGFRFMRRGYISAPHKTILDAIESQY